MNKKRVIIFVMLFFCAPILFLGCSKNEVDYFNISQSRQIERLAVSDGVELTQTVAPAIVGIESTSGNSGNIGSGVCVKSGGYIVTNYHVISNGGKITLYLDNNSVCSAICIYKNASTDIAVLKANYALPYLTLATSDIKVGEDVYAVGTPLSLTFKQTFTKGIVSAVNRDLLVSSADVDGGTMLNLIQHDASINAGNSGGPLLNAFGEVVGINTLKIANAEGMGFAIPTTSFSHILDNL